MTKTAGEHIARWLTRRRMTQTALAERCGLSQKHVSQVINGSAALSARTAVLIERELGVSARVLLIADIDHALARTRELFDRGWSD